MALNFKIYLSRLLKNIDDDSKISSLTLVSLDNLIKINIEKIMKGINELMAHSSKKTISHKEVIGSVNLLFPKKVANNTITFIEQSIDIFKKNKKDKLKGSKSFISGLVFPVTKIQNYAMKFSLTSRKSEKFSIAITAACEYLLLSILEKSMNISKKNKRVRITNRYVVLAIDSDEDMKKIYSNCIFSGGVAQYTPKKEIVI